MGFGENSTGKVPLESQSQNSGSNRGRVGPTWEMGFGAEAQLEIGKGKSRWAAKGQRWESDEGRGRA